MAELIWNGRVLEAENNTRLDIRDIVTIQTETGTVFVTAGGSSAGMMSITVSANGKVSLLDEIANGTSGAGVSSLGISLIETPDGLMAVTGTHGANGLVGRLVDPETGQFTTKTLTIQGGVDSPVVASIGDVLYTAPASGGLAWHSPNGPNGFKAGSAMSDNAATHLDGIVAMTTLPGAGGKDILLTLSRGDDGLSAFTLNPANGTPSLGGSLGTQNGLGLLDEPLALETVMLNGVPHAIILSTAGNGLSSALSVVAVAPDGDLSPKDHILDSLGTRFGSATEMAIVEVDGRAYVLAGGNDGGLSLFALSPGGRLLHLDTIEQTVGSGLGSISALEMAAIGDQLTILAASETHYGLARLSYDISDQGVTHKKAVGALTGGAGDDILEGGYGANTLTGGAGDDILIDGAGVDRLTGGAGRDVFYLAADGARDVITDFTPGQDRIDLSLVPMLYGPHRLSIAQKPWGAVVTWGESDALELRSANGQPLSEAQVLAAFIWTTDRPPLIFDEIMRGTEGADTLKAPDGGGIVQALGGADVVSGSAMEDRLEGGTGRDSLHGNAGTDRLFGEQDNDMLEGGLGHDSLDGGAGSDKLYGGDGEDVLWGQNGNDQLFGGAQFDTLHGGAGNDTVWGGLGRDLAYLGTGHDVFVDTAQGGTLGNDTVYGGLGNDRITGDMGWDVFYGEDGDDTIRGGLGNDSLLGGAGADSLHGGYNFDTLNGGIGHDTLDGFDGNDLLIGGEGNDLILGGAQFDTIRGGNGNDTVYGGLGRDWIELGAGNDVFVDTDQGAGLGNDTVYGGAGADRLQATSGWDVLFGGAGDDTLRGGWGEDRLYGEWGDDSLHAGLHADTVYGGTGNDTLDGYDGADSLEGGAGNDLIFGGAAFDTIRGGDGNDTVYGGLGRDLIFLDSGNDVFIDTAQSGVLGYDTVFGGAGNDRITGNMGWDVFHGGAGRDTLSGGVGNDWLAGNDDQDLLRGGEGNDTLTGGLGNDTLTGGVGADVFIFRPNHGADRITDFQRGVDALRLDMPEVPLQLTATGQGVRVDWDTGSVVLEGVNISLFNADDVVFL